MNHKFWMKTLCAGTMFAGLAFHAQAQTTGAVAAAAAAAAAPTNVGEVVVTAQRREERLVDVPISITAVTGDTMRSQGITSATDLDRVVPGLVFYTTASHASPTIRGVGSTLTGPGADNPVAVYVDGVYQSAASALLFDFDNIQQVEVLKGPQGTLFGRNATGGAVTVRTYQPSNTPEARATLSYGSLNETTVRAYGNLPLGDQVAANLAFFYRHGDGYTTNLFYNSKIPGPKEVGFSPKIKWTPNEKLSVTLGGLFVNHRDDKYEYFGPYKRRPAAFSGTPGSTFALPGVREVNQDFKGVWDTHNRNADLHIQYDADAGTFTSITGYTNYYGDLDFDLNQAPSNTGYVHSHDQAQTTSEELNFASKQMGPLSFVTGVYLYHDNARRQQFLWTSTDPAIKTLLSISYRAQILTDAWAVFAEANYDVTSDLHLILGARYSDEKKEFNFGSLANAAITGTNSKTWNGVTPRAVVRYDLNDQSNIYASYSQGFKSGTYNPSVNPSPATASNAPVSPEDVKAVEVGYKISSHGNRFGTSIFYNDYKDIQVNIQLSPGILAYQNAGKATIYGWDFDFSTNLTDDLVFSGGGAYTHGEYDDFPGAPHSDGTNAAVTFFNAKGNTTTRTPKFTGNVGLTYTHKLDNGTLGANAGLSYNSGFFVAPDNRVKSPSYTLLNGELSWTTPDDRYRFAVWGRNLTDADKILYLTGSNSDLVIWDAPRTYGVSFTANFR